MSYYILLLALYLSIIFYIGSGYYKSKNSVPLKSGTLNNTQRITTNDEKRAFFQTRISQNGYYLNLAFWATFISGVISLFFVSAILFKFSFIEDLNISELIKLMTCLTSFSFSSIFAFLIKEFNKTKLELIREYNKIEN